VSAPVLNGPNPLPTWAVRCADDVYQRVRREFTYTEIVNLTMAIVAINGWNRIAVAMRMVAGTHKPGKV